MLETALNFVEWVYL